jgi:hypothetical protein
MVHMVPLNIPNNSSKQSILPKYLQNNNKRKLNLKPVVNEILKKKKNRFD